MAENTGDISIELTVRLVYDDDERVYKVFTKAPEDGGLTSGFSLLGIFDANYEAFNAIADEFSYRLGDARKIPDWAK